MGLQFYLQSTMLIERLCGVGLYCLVLLVVCNGITVSKPGSVKKWLIFYAVVLAVMGFFFVPSSSTDLARLTAYMHDWSAQSISWLVGKCASSSTPAYIAYFWLVGQLHVDGLLPAITALIFYGLVFSCYWDFASRDSIPNKAVALGLLAFMSLGTFLQVISGIRSYLGFALVFRAIYTEWFKGRMLVFNLPLYILAGTMHSASLILVVTRFLFLVFQKTNGRYGRFAAIVSAGLGVFLFAWIGGDYLAAAVDKANSYITGEVYSYAWETLIHLIAVMCALVSLRACKTVRDGSSGLHNVWFFAAATFIVSTCFLPFDYSIFLRFTTVGALFVPLLAMSGLKPGIETGSLTSEQIGYRKLMIFLSVIALLLACARGDLSAYKFFLSGGAL